MMTDDEFNRWVLVYDDPHQKSERANVFFDGVLIGGYSVSDLTGSRCWGIGRDPELTRRVKDFLRERRKREKARQGAIVAEQRRARKAKKAALIAEARAALGFD